MSAKMRKEERKKMETKNWNKKGIPSPPQQQHPRRRFFKTEWKGKPKKKMPFQ